MKKLSLPLFGFLFLQACALIPQNVTLKPDVTFKETTLGKGTPITITVSDERPDKVIGYRGFMGNSGTINTTDDLSGIVQQKITEGFTKKGFKVIPDKTVNSRSLKVEIRNLQYVATMGFWTGGVVTKAALKALAADGNETYEQMYREEQEERVLFVPFADTNEQRINDTLAIVIADLFRDGKLMDFLSKPGNRSASNTPPAESPSATITPTPSSSATGAVNRKSSIQGTIPDNIHSGDIIKVTMKDGTENKGSYLGEDVQGNVWLKIGDKAQTIAMSDIKFISK